MGGGFPKPKKYSNEPTLEGLDLLAQYHMYKTGQKPNIAIIGPECNGKSALLNSLYKAIGSIKSSIVNEGEGSETDTTKHTKHELRNICLWDTRGLPNTNEHEESVAKFVTWCCQGYIPNGMKINISDFKKGTSKISHESDKINAIIVVQSIGENARISENVLKALRKVKSETQIPMVICFSKADIPSKESQQIREKTMSLLGIASQFTFDCSNYCGKISGNNDPERDKVFIEMLHQLLWRIDGEGYHQEVGIKCP